jgi:glycosyltransferase involved in cell wall biosynthesis
LQTADIFVLPSLIEGHPKVLIEALSCGLPAIASRVSGNIEVIKDGKTGLLCSTDGDDINKKLDFLIENSNIREKIGQKGRKYALKYCDLAQLVLKEIEILKKIGKNA